MWHQTQTQVQFLIRTRLVALEASQNLPCRWAYGRRHILSGRILLLAFRNLLASLSLLAFLNLQLLLILSPQNLLQLSLRQQ